MKKYLVVYGKPRYLGITESEIDIEKGKYIVVESKRGEELAVAAGEINEEQEHEYRLLRNMTEHGDSAPKSTEPVVTDLKFIAGATKEDMDEQQKFREEEDAALKLAQKLLQPHALEMKLIDVEFLYGRKKLFLYFSADQRIDFRAYVRDLAREFRTRIELRQIGVRDEAKIIRGVGPCGRPCCCSYWLNRFEPICIKMVKEQNLALNPSKISGICGRLMCCMCYEHNVYSEAWKNLPNPGSKIKTPTGNVILTGVDIATNKVRCYVPEHGEVKVPIDDFDKFREKVTSGEEWITEEEAEAQVTASARAAAKQIFFDTDMHADMPASESDEGSGEQEGYNHAEKPRRQQDDETSEGSRRRRSRRPKRARPPRESEDAEQGGQQPAPAEKQKPHRSRRRRSGRGKRPEAQRSGDALPRTISE